MRQSGTSGHLWTFNNKRTFQSSGLDDKVPVVTLGGWVSRDSPPELLPGDDAVVLGERLLLDAALNPGQQSAAAAGRSRFDCRAVVVLEAAPGSGVHPRTLVDHGVD